MLAIGLVIAAPIVGALLHELTHGVVATVLGAKRVDVDIRRLFVEYEMAETEPLWKDRVVNLAPQIVGVAVASAFILVGSRPSGVVGLAGVLCWGVYTIMGGLEDYSLSAAHGDETPVDRVRDLWWEMDGRARDATLSSLLVVLGVFAWGIGYQIHGQIGLMLVRIADGTFAAAMILGLATVIRLERSTETR